MDLLTQFIPVVQAQGLDAVAQPTFGPINISTTPDTESGVQVLLKTTDNTVAEGTTFAVEARIEAGVDGVYTGYKLVLNYDPQILSVVDQDPGSSGTQSKFTDGLYALAGPVEDNNYATIDGQNGIIFLHATGSEFPLNRSVLEIKFQAQELGLTELTIDTTPITGTEISSGGNLVGFNPSSLTINVNETGTATSCSNDGDCPTGEICLDGGICGSPPPASCNINADCPVGQICRSNQCIDDLSCTFDSDCSAGHSCISGACVLTGCVSSNDCSVGEECVANICEPMDIPPLPQTALFDSVGSTVAFIFAIGLIAVGLFLKRLPREDH